jgi:Glycosyltransferase like family
MIAFGCSIAESEPYRRYAEPGIRLAAEPDSAIYPYSSVGSIFRSYNLLLDAAARHEDLEALALVHPHAEIVDPDFCAKVRTALSDPRVAVVGCAGATGVRSIAWWEGSLVAGPVIHRYHQHGGGELPAYSWTHAEQAPQEVETVDGFLMVLSPWTVRNVRFDESLGLGHGFDLDYCLQVREKGREVVAADLAVVHHRSLDLIGDLDMWVEAHVRLAEKWEDRFPGGDVNGATWRERARRAEAEREAARAVAYGYALGTDARVLELERAMAQATESLSWRITAPLRRVNRLRREAAQRRVQRRTS